MELSGDPVIVEHWSATGRCGESLAVGTYHLNALLTSAKKRSATVPQTFKIVRR
jgi:hypothetical protein